jgi:hypothetical protein
MECLPTHSNISDLVASWTSASNFFAWFSFDLISGLSSTFARQKNFYGDVAVLRTLLQVVWLHWRTTTKLLA